MTKIWLKGKNRVGDNFARFVKEQGALYLDFCSSDGNFAVFKKSKKHGTNYCGFELFENGNIRFGGMKKDLDFNEDCNVLFPKELDWCIKMLEIAKEWNKIR